MFSVDYRLDFILEFNAMKGAILCVQLLGLLGVPNMVLLWYWKYVQVRSFDP